MEASVVIEAAEGSIEEQVANIPVTTPLYQRSANARKITVYSLNQTNPPTSKVLPLMHNVKKTVYHHQPGHQNLQSPERLLLTIPGNSLSSPSLVADRKSALADGANNMTEDTFNSLNDELQVDNAEEHELYQMIASNETIPITCRKKHAVLHKSKLGSGKNGKCIYFENNWFTPSEFEHHCGLEGSKDWKRSLRFGGRAVLTLIQKGYLRPHASSCTCGTCSDDTSLLGPVKYYTPVSRRKRTSSTAFCNLQSNLNEQIKMQECQFKIHEQQADALAPHNNESFTPIPGELLDLMQSTNTPLYKVINRVFQAVNKVSTDDRNSWEKLKVQADEIFDKYAKLQEAIEKTKLECEERRNNLLKEIISTLKNCDHSSDTIPAKSLHLEKPLEDHDEGPDDEVPEICQACGQPANSECTGCHKATYCSTECQEKDWNAGHREACRTLQGLE